MGQKAIYKCNKCGNTFQSQEGGGFNFIEYRCINCDTIKAIVSNCRVSSGDYKPPTKKEIGVREKCGGELRDGLKPMCPKCKSRDIKQKEILLMYD